MKITIHNSQQYTWGGSCKGWHLVNNKMLSVILETMPPGTKEVRHRHSTCQQFFYILKGEATFVIEDEELKIKKDEGVHIKPNMMHQIMNHTDKEIEFIVVSQPHSHGDRIINNNENANT